MKRVPAFVQRLGGKALELRLQYGLSAATRAEMRLEREPLRARDIPIACAISEALAWLECAQDNSSSADGGVSRHYSLLTGWGPSYPETTGYIVPTFISEGRSRGSPNLLKRARRMLDWLGSVQMPCGAFQGSTVDSSVVVPVAFNTGQILLGLAAGVAEFGQTYREAMMAAADWLVRTQDRDGCWRKHPSPFTAPGEKTYETHAAWGLFEAARLGAGHTYAEAAMRNVYWALSHQNDNGWFANCCLTDPTSPLTHTIGYTLRGLLEAYRFSGDRKILQGAIRTAEGVLGALRSNGDLPGRLDSRWQGTVEWSCLTGTEQIAICWLLLYRETSDARFLNAAVAANRRVRQTLRIVGPPETRGAVKGSFPISGDYERFRYPNWACKFFIDANSLEQTICEENSERPIPVFSAAAGISN